MIDLSDVLLGICLLAFTVAAFLVSPIAGLIVLGLVAGFLALATVGAQPFPVRLPKVRLPWRS